MDVTKGKDGGKERKGKERKRKRKGKGKGKEKEKERKGWSSEELANLKFD